VPCRQSPHKDSATGATGGQRLEMLRLLTNDLPWAEVSDYELTSPGESFSWKTAQYFHDQLPAGGELFWILGVDQWTVIETWSRPGLLAELLTFIVLPRAGVTAQEKPGFRTCFLKGSHPASASEVRLRCRSGDDVSTLVTPEVESFIRAGQLYLH